MTWNWYDALVNNTAAFIGAAVMEIRTIQQVGLKEVWPHEANDSTPWLAENLQLPGDELGIERKLEGTETSIGNFSLDILAKETSSGAVVTIQIDQMDHTHLRACLINPFVTSSALCHLE